MSFNYLQTDDRDDYFKQFGRSKERKKPTGYTLISPEGENIFEKVPMFKVRTYCKKNYLPIGKGDYRFNIIDYCHYSDDDTDNGRCHLRVSK